MMRVRALAVVVVLAACQALPSSVPLANTGGVLTDDGTTRDRRASDALPGTPSVVLPSVGPNVAARSSAAPSSKEPPPDAGTSAPPASAADGGPIAVAWAGDYYGSDKLVRHFEGDSDDVELDDKAHTRVEVPSPGTLLISIVNSATGDTICALKATANGGEATVNDGQSCFSEEGATASLSNGRASLTGDKLVLDFTGKVEAEADEDGDTIEFGLEYHFDGRRR
ncbi:MAG TPA: hypothetical protein VNN72_13170 [Polyangiaceae bacterium]|nr:hypothetical protein [Polyangiaceae bacterium]